MHMLTLACKALSDRTCARPILTKFTYGVDNKEALHACGLGSVNWIQISISTRKGVMVPLGLP